MRPGRTIAASRSKVRHRCRGIGGAPGGAFPAPRRPGNGRSQNRNA
jgi:hypothetical protein